MANSQGKPDSRLDIVLLLSLGAEVCVTWLTDELTASNMLDIAAGSCSAFRWRWMEFC